MTDTTTLSCRRCAYRTTQTQGNLKRFPFHQCPACGLPFAFEPLSGLNEYGGLEFPSPSELPLSELTSYYDDAWWLREAVRAYMLECAQAWIEHHAPYKVGDVLCITGKHAQGRSTNVRITLVTPNINRIDQPTYRGMTLRKDGKTGLTREIGEIYCPLSFTVTKI